MGFNRFLTLYSNDNACVWEVVMLVFPKITAK